MTRLEEAAVVALRDLDRIGRMRTYEIPYFYSVRRIMIPITRFIDLMVFSLFLLRGRICDVSGKSKVTDDGKSLPMLPRQKFKYLKPVAYDMA